MDLDDIFEIICSYLDESIVNNVNFVKIKEMFLNILNVMNEDYSIQIAKNIYLENEELQDDNIYAIENEGNCIFSLETENEKLYFSMTTNEVFVVSLKCSIENEYYEDIAIDLEMSEDLNIWQTIKEVYDDRNYYHDFIVDIVAYDSNQVRVNCEECYDERLNIFQEEFGIDREMAKKCINNFVENKKFLNNAKMMLEMKTMDDMFSLDYCKFVEPLRMSNFKERVLSDIEKYFDGDFEITNLIYSRVNNIYSNLLSVIGDDNEFVMSFNLILNIIHYVMMDSDVLYTNGILIKKLNDSYLKYNIHISEKELIVITSNIDEEELLNLYLSAECNKDTQGLNEFFGFGNRRYLG